MVQFLYLLENVTLSHMNSLPVTQQAPEKGEAIYQKFHRKVQDE